MNKKRSEREFQGISSNFLVFSNVDDKGEGGVKIFKEWGDIIYGWPLRRLSFSFDSSSVTSYTCVSPDISCSIELHENNDF